MNVQTTAEKVVDMSEPAPNNLPAVPSAPQPKTPAAKPEPKHFPPRLAKALLAITREIGLIGKEGRNDFQRYNYARWEDINDKLSPLLAEHGILIIQSETSRSLLEENDKGSTLAIVYEFTIVNEHGEQWPPITWTAISRLRDQKGITDDKAAAKCHTQAEKYFCIKQFKIRTSDAIDNDAGDGAVTHLPKKDSTPLYKTMQAEIYAARSVVELQTWGKGAIERAKVLPPDWQAHLRLRYNEKMADLKEASQTTETWDEQTGELTPTPEAWDKEMRPETSSKWEDMSPAQQAGILCNEPAFWRFLNDTHSQFAVNGADSAAAAVRAHCIVDSRADIKNGHPSGKLWRALVAEYRAWQREPAVTEPAAGATQEAAKAPANNANPPAPAGAADPIPTAELYAADWNARIDRASRPEHANQIGEQWASEKRMRELITWGDPPEWQAIKKRIEKAIAELKAAG
jgi:hypothetical protein